METLRILSANVNSIKQREVELKRMIDEHSPEVICIQETKMRSVWKPDGYLEAKSLPSGKKNTSPKGLKVLLKEGIDYDKIETIQSSDQKRLELAAVDIYLPRRRKLRIINTYISPSIAEKREQISIYNEVIKATKSSPLTLSIGDSNSKLDLPQHENTNPLGDVLQGHLETGEIYAFVPTEYTRYDPAGRQPSTIDIAITTPDNADLISDIKVLEDIGSDHRPVLFTTTLQVEAPRSSAPPAPNFEKADWRLFKSTVTSAMPNAPDIKPTAPSMVNAAIFMTETIDEADKVAIPRRKPGGYKQRELPAHILALIDEKRILRDLVQTKNEKQHKTRVNWLGKEIKRQVKHFDELGKQLKWEKCTEKSPHGFYKLARKSLNPNKSTTSTYPLKDANGARITTDQEKVTAFKELYDQIFSPPPETPESATIYEEARRYHQEILDKYKDVKERPQGHDLNPKVTADDIIIILKNVKSTSPGQDGIYYKHVRNLPEVALQYLAKLYEMCHRCSYFPDIWKHATTVLPPKPNKDHSDPKNYRPISLLSVLGKILEKLINKKLKEYLEVNKLLPESQAGFRPKRSTQDQLLKLCHEVIHSIQTGCVAVATFFDVQKAFDKVIHEGFVLKCKRIGLSEVTTALLANYLNNRTTKIKLNGILSEAIQLKAGTPQGAIISPTLFNIWVYDIPQPKEKTVSLSQFADDVGTWAWSRKNSCTNARDKLQAYDNKLISWCNKWNILLCPSKTQLIVFYKKEPKNLNKVYIKVKGEKVKPSKTVTFLGVQLDERLTLKQHHKKQMTDAKRRMALFAAITGSHRKPRANSEISIKILKSMIEPLFYYAPTTMCLKTKGMFKDQDTLLRKCARLAMHCPPTVRNEYIEEIAKLKNSKQRTHQLAIQYITDTNRSDAVKKLVQKHQTSRTIKYKRKSPLDILMS